MMEAPRRAWSGLLLGLSLALSAPAQDPQKDPAAPIKAEIKKVEEKIKEESERVARKKENLQVEFAALQREETKTAILAKLTEIGNKHRASLKGPASKPGDAESKPVTVPDSVKNAITEEARAALSSTVGRNLATVLDTLLATNLIAVLRGDAPVDYPMVLNETIGELFEGTDFEANYRKLIPVFEKKLQDLQGELAALNQRIADLELEARGRAANVPPGMVHVAKGKYKIGSDTAEFVAINKLLRFGGNNVNIDKYTLGWPVHEVELDDFYIDINEVTNKFYDAFLKDTGHKPPKGWPSSTDSKPADAVAPNGASSGPKKADFWTLPVAWVTYDDMLAFCEWCGRRPPTEFEWEAAARARTGGEKSYRWWPWGDTYDPTKPPFCNNQTASGKHPLRQGQDKLTPVGTFPQGKSALGLNDMAGNVAEMTSSRYEAYPGWDDKKVPSTNQGKDGFSPAEFVIRGGTALASELQTLTTTRRGFSKQSAELVGFRTAMSRARGKDFFQTVAGDNRLAAQLEPVGPPQKDEKSGRAELALQDPTRYTALMAGGWDPEKQTPARAHFIALACRNTTEYTDPARIKSMAREHKKPLMLGYFTTSVDFTKPEIPKGAYWVMWDPGRVKDKLALPEGVIFRSVSNPENVYDALGVNPVLVARSTEATKLVSEKQGSLLSMIMSFPVRDRKEARFIVEIRLECAPEALKPYK